MVLVLDTNVISELIRLEPNVAVQEWMRRNGEVTALTTITRAELRFGVGRMPRGARRQQVAAAVDAVLAEFEVDTLPFDRRAADRYGELAAHQEGSGAPKPMADTMIAAICLANGCGLVTRNTADFDDAGLVALINPFGE